MQLVIHGGCIALFFLLGVIFWKGKGAFLIAGYNTASPAEKRRTDEKVLCRFMAKLMWALAACWVPVLFSAVLGRMWLFWLGQGAFLLVTFGGVVYANTGNRFRKY